MYLKSLELSGFKSFAKKTILDFTQPISAVVGPNGSGKSNITEGLRFVLGEQSMKSMRGKRGEDLIWNGSQTAPRANQATVAITFDNRKRVFDIDFDEVTLKRSVYRDGTNEYFINGSQVRLRDIIELLARVHIGATGHHIISQGEADRILNSSIKERRIMIEETLGLKIYHWKIDESEKKLEKTEENLKQVESLRREIAPHLRFLKKQMERIEKGREMRKDLADKYEEYLAREKAYLLSTKQILEAEIKVPTEGLKGIDDTLRALEEKTKADSLLNEKTKRLVSLERERDELRSRKETITREMGRLEGMVMYEEKRIEREKEKGAQSVLVPFGEVSTFAKEVEEVLLNIQKANELSRAKELADELGKETRVFISEISESFSKETPDDGELVRIRAEIKAFQEKLGAFEAEEKQKIEEYESLRSDIEADKDMSRETERELFALSQKRTELRSLLHELRLKEDIFKKDETAFTEELREGGVLIGRDILRYESKIFSGDLEESRTAQEERRKEIEKLKIRIEDIGAGGGEDIAKEFEEVSERDQFLEREITDLVTSAESLRALIKELNEKLDIEFKDGIKKINTQFQEFFSLMFGGGSASLEVIAKKKKISSDAQVLGEDEVPQEEEIEEGIDIAVSLPRKKIKGLVMLSGGERALTSIALIFALSQVNPPPFLVLDETDAALDESNSRKYGDMIEGLSKHSQLIVVTHNRETMSRAHALYGVTMGSDAVSKVLSVKFDEATLYAK